MVLTTTVLDIVFQEQGPIKGSEEHKALQKQMVFAHRTALGKLPHAHVICRPDIGFEANRKRVQGW